MNTNSNVYTIIYTTVIVVVVAAVLAFVSTSLKPMQNANIKAETLSQMMTAAGLGSKEDFSKMGNDGVLGTYSENIEQAFTVNLAGERTGELKTAKDEIELIDNLKPQNKAILAAGEPQLPVYKFKSGVTVVPVYGAGLWGPIWGYIALEEDLRTIAGAYFDHDSETPGLGAKIKDEPSFKAQFEGKVFNLENPSNPFDIVKGGAPEGAMDKIDAISGATMTCNGLNQAIDIWIGAYANYFSKAAAAQAETTEEE